jgi:hypothetical protein
MMFRIDLPPALPGRFIGIDCAGGGAAAALF